MSGTTPERLLKRNRALRWLEIFLLVLNVAVAGFDAATGHVLLVLIPAVVAVLLIGALRLNAHVTARLLPQCQPPAVPQPKVLARRPEPFCLTCELDEAESDEHRERVLRRSYAAFSLGSPYNAHLACWVTTGNERELERMLRHVSWQSS